MKRKFFLTKIFRPALVAVLLMAFLTGCGGNIDESKQTYTQLSSGKLIEPSRPDGLLSGADLNNPYPVIATLDSTLYATIGYYDKSGTKLEKEKRYLWIDQAFISAGKIAEGQDCLINHIKKLSYDACREKYPLYSKIALESKSTALPDSYEDEAYIMEENFRSQKLALDGKVFDIIFLLNETQTQKIAEKDSGGIFDIFILESKAAELDQPNKNRGEITGYDEGGNKQLAALSLRQILENCGQQTTTAVAPTAYGEIREGSSAGTSGSATGAVSSIMPQSITLNGVTSGVLNSDLLKVGWTLGGELPSDGVHSGFTSQTNLETQINDLRAIETKPNKVAEFIGAKLTNAGASSYLTVEVKIKGQTRSRYFLYHPSSSKAAQIVSQTSEESGSSAARIDWFSVNQDLGLIKGDPWCGFTPESKPAIYLYPKTRQTVFVQVNPQNGWMTVSDPLYGNGWVVEALPDGFINYNNKTYRHLFYEAMLPTPKMSQEFDVIDGANLKIELQNLGKKLSLSDREAKELSDYWSAKLPNKNYYQVGLMTGAQVDQIEPMKVSPAPESVWRVRLIFKGLDQKIAPPNPISQLNFERTGFSLVEWGGFVLK